MRRNIMLNEVPNSNDATHVWHVANNENYHGHTAILNGGYIAIMQKSQLTR